MTEEEKQEVRKETEYKNQLITQHVIFKMFNERFNKLERKLDLIIVCVSILYMSQIIEFFLNK